MFGLKRKGWWLVVAVLLTGMAGQGGPPGLQIRTVRLYGPGQQTYVRTFVQIPLTQFKPAPDGRICYEISFGVQDSTGLVLKQEKWTAHTTRDANLARASAMEMIQFAVVPGRYHLVVAATDSSSGATVKADSIIEGFSEVPLTSDLVLSPGIRAATAADSLPQPGEWRHDKNVVVVGVATLGLTPLRSRAFYLLEVYSAEQDSGTMAVTVTDSSGRAVVRTKPAPIRIDAGGGVLKGEMDLAGLPGGSYQFAVSVTLGSRTIERSAMLTMEGLTEALARDSADHAADTLSDEGYFWAMTPEQLDAAEAPLFYIAQSRELTPYSNKLSASAKVRFLAEFWRRRDPTPDQVGNPARDGFYHQINFANEQYREGGRGTQPGWRSDRGRIYLKFGAPDELYRRQPAGKTPPMEIWKYTRTRNRFFVFADRNLVGLYTLLVSNELKEPGIPNWQDVLGPYGVRALGEYVNGVNPNGPAGSVGP